ncbi:MAG: hypothetical protein ACI865_001375 [Flavobacteriaceae bacterium]|jgi:hypothetical protein
MKITTPLLLIMSILWLITPTSSFAQCNYTINSLDSTLCAGDSTVLFTQGAADSLQTTLAAGNNHRGNMFDIVALNTITITAFDAHPQANTTIEIYYKIGGYAGFEATSGAWTLVGSAAVTANPLGTSTPVPVPVNVTIPAGQTYAFYVTSSNVAVSLNYTNGTGLGNIWAQDANIQFLEGAGMEYPFTAGGGIFSPRIWNGLIHYEIPLDYLWNTGATSSSITVSPTLDTDYWVTVTDALNACNNTDSILVTVAVPPVVGIGPDTTVCAADSLYLDAGNPGLTYLWNTGGINQQLAALSSGTYYVDVIDASGCIGSDTAIVTVILNPVNLGADTSICYGTTLTLDAGINSSYLWSTSDITQTIDISAAGTYFVDVTDVNTCVGTDSINILVVGPAVDLGPDTTICDGNSIILDAGALGNGYLWSTTDNTQTISVSSAATYSVNVTDFASGCIIYDEIVITTADAPVAGFTSTPTLLTVNFTNTSVDATTYAWDFGDAGTSTLMDPSHVYAASGTYTVILIATGPCGSDTTQTDITVDNVGIDENLFGQAIRLYPNPTEGNILLNVESVDEAIVVNILSLNGQILSSTHHNNSKIIELSIDKAAGIYMVELMTETGKSKRFRVVKK